MSGWAPSAAGSESNPNALAQASGFVAWSIDPIQAAFAGTQANTHLVGVFLNRGDALTGIAIFCSSAGVAVTFSKVGVYDASLNLVVASVDNNTAFQSTGWKKTPFTSIYTVPSSGLYYLASGFVATTTLPSVLNFQQNAASSTPFPAGTKLRGVHAQVPTVGQSLPNPAVSAGTFVNVPLLCAY